MSERDATSTPDFERLLEKLPGLYWTWAADGTCTYAGPQVGTFTGLPREALSGQGWRWAVHPDDLAAVDGERTRALGSARELRVDLRLRRHDGVYRWFDVQGRPELDGDGRVVGWTVAGTKRAHRKQTDQELADGEARFRTLFSSMDEGFQLCELVYDAHGRADDYRFLEVNPTFERLSGLTRVQVIGRTVRELLPEIEQHWIDLYVRVAESGEPRRYEGFAGGTGRWYEVYVFSPSKGRFAAISVDTTERRRTEESLRESEARLKDAAASLQRTNAQLTSSQEQYRLLNQATHDVIWDWDLRKGTVSWNEAIESAFGSRCEDVPPGIGWWSAHIHPEDRARVTQALQAVLDQPAARSWVAEYRFRHRQGHWLSVLDRGFVARDETGRAVRMIGSIIDLTERKRAEEALRRSEEQFRYLADAMPQMVWITKADGYHEYFNRQWDEFTGGRRGDSYGQLWTRVLHPDDVERTLQRWRHSLATGEPYEIEYRFRRRDGVYRWFLGRALPVRDPAGRVLRWFGTCTDITDQKLAEESLQESEARAQDRYADLEEIYRHAPVGLFTFDREYRFMRINETMAEINGLSVEAHFGRTMKEIVPELDDFLREVYRPVFERGEPVLGVEIHGTTPKAPGVARDWIGNYYPLKSRSGEVVGLIGAVLEVTERKRAERALRVSEEQLLEADRRKNEFLAVLSHELRNPLSPIRNSVYVMERAAPGGEQARRALGVIDRQITHMARLIDDLLDVTRISRGKIRLQRESLELNEIVRGTGEDLRELFRRHGITLEMRICQRPLRAFADRTRIAQVVGNLLQNAAKFTARGGRTELCLQVRETEAEIEVRDDGAGMDPEFIGRLFAPFVQADQTLDRNRGGLGLGLALVKGLVELHGGTVTAFSEGAGRGSVFTVRLPLEAQAAPHLTLVRSASLPPGGGVLKVLVVEDNVDTASSLREVLELNGHSVEVALTGEEGIVKARQLLPDVVLCDLGLPEIDGYGVARALRADPRLRSTFLVAISGYALQEDVERAKDAGFDRHMAKPPDMAALERALAEGASGISAG